MCTPHRILSPDEFRERFEWINGLVAKAREKYGLGIRATALDLLAQVPEMPEEEFWRVLAELWVRVTPADNKWCREFEPPPEICGYHPFLNPGHREEAD